MASAIFLGVICAQCGEQEAMVFIRRSGGPSEGCDLVLCESCANRRGISAGKGGLELNMDDLIGVGLDADPAPGKALSCPSCGLELGDLRREGRLGCSTCADAFRDELVRAVGRREQPRRGPRAIAPIPAAVSAAAPPSAARGARLNRELESALKAENYEEAARLRDAIFQLPVSASSSLDIATHERPGSAFLLEPQAFSGVRGPEDDVVLSSSARIHRDLEGLPFPGSPRGPSAPSRSLLLSKILALPDWEAWTMAELDPAARRSLSERGLLPRGYASDDESVLLTRTSLRGFALLDEGDHLRVRSLLPGLDLEGAMREAAEAVESLGLEFANKPELGWICSRIADCGLGCSLSATLHLPALAAAGMKDRLFKALLAEGLVVRGFYSSSEESAGAVYEIGMEASSSPTPQAMIDSFGSAMLRAVAAERRARAEISERGRSALADAEGRAFGLTRYFVLSGNEEAASLLSVLRLAALRGSLAGADHRILGCLLTALGSGSMALASGRSDIPSAGEQEVLRARVIKKALAKAEYRLEEGS
jgi:protein-arginine kinase/protein-arginine kinase activator protein McsA